MNKKTINNIVIDESKLGNIYPILGSGREGIVYKYNDNKVIKIFNKKEIDYSNIIDRISYLISLNLNIKNVVFPQNFVINTKNEIIGYSMKLIKYNKYKSFFNLNECESNEEFINYFYQVQETVKKLHKNNIFIGDFNPNNIMIDEDNNPVLIDTVNFKTSKFDFLHESYNSLIYEKMFNTKCSSINNDKFMFSFLFLSYFISSKDLEQAIKNPKYFKILIDTLNIRNSSKKILYTIFSKENNKEYLDNIFIDLKKKEHIRYNNKFGIIIHKIFG